MGTYVQGQAAVSVFATSDGLDVVSLCLQGDAVDKYPNDVSS